MKRDVRYADQEIRVEGLARVSNLAEEFLRGCGLRQEDARVSIESSCGPFLILSFPRWCVMQDLAGRVAVLDVVPYAMESGRYWPVVRATDDGFEAFVVHAEGHVLFYRSIVFLRNQVSPASADDVWRGAFFSGEHVVCLSASPAPVFGTTHGRVCRVSLCNGCVELEESFVVRENSIRSRPQSISKAYFQERDGVQKNRKVSGPRGHEDDEEFAAVLSGFVAPGGASQYLDILDQEKQGQKCSVLQVVQTKDTVACLTASATYLFGGQRLRLKQTLEFSYLQHFSFLGKEDFIELKPESQGRFCLCVEDFQLLGEDELLILANFKNTAQLEVKRVALVRIDLKTKRCSLQFLRQPTNSKQDRDRDRNPVQEVIRTSAELFSQPGGAIQFPAGMEGGMQLLYDKKFRAQLNIRVAGELYAVPLLETYSEGFVVHGTKHVELFPALFDPAKTRQERKSDLNQIPDPIRRIFVQYGLRALSRDQIKLLDPGYKFSLGTDWLKMYIGYPGLRIGWATARPIQLQSMKTSMLRSQGLGRSLGGFQETFIQTAALCGPGTSQGSQRKMQSNTVLVYAKAELLAVYQFNKSVLEEVFRQKPGQPQISLAQNFANYIRNEELQAIPGGLSDQQINEEVEEVVCNIAKRPVFKNLNDRQWFSRDRDSVLNGGIVPTRGIGAGEHEELLRSYEEGSAQKCSELIYLAYFLREIQWWDRLDFEVKTNLQGAVDATVGSGALLRILLELLQKGAFSEVIQIEQTLSKNLENHAHEELREGLQERLTLLETALSKPTVQTKFNLVLDTLLSTHKLEHLAEYLQSIQNARLQNADQLDTGFAMREVWSLTAVEACLQNQGIQLRTRIRLTDSVLFFSWDVAKAELLLKAAYMAAQQVPEYCIDMAHLLARYQAYDLCTEYWAQKIHLRQPAPEDRANFLLYSTELRAKGYPLVKRLAFYYQQHKDFQQNVEENVSAAFKPSFLEVENRRAQLNMARGAPIPLLLPETILEVFSKAILDEQAFCKDGTQMLGMLFKHRFEHQIPWIADIE